MTQNLAQSIISGNRRALGKGITLIESTRPEHRVEACTLMDQIMPHTGKSIRIGISGTPGVGKSTFIEALGKYVLKKNYRLAVLAVDPSSPIGSGSILGDKTRMQYLSAHKNTFIRPSPSKGHLGGVASKTREAILLCEAAGYDFIIVETVGVGQSEFVVNSMVDQFLFLQLPNSGDQLQGIKKGILELANFILVNKCDGTHVQAAKRAKVDLDLALNLIYQSRPDEKPDVKLISSLEETGLDEVLEHIEALIDSSKKNSAFESRRKNQAVHWFEEEVRDSLLRELFSIESIKIKYDKEKDLVENLQKSSRQAAAEFKSSVNLGSHYA